MSGKIENIKVQWLHIDNKQKRWWPYDNEYWTHWKCAKEYISVLLLIWSVLEIAYFHKKFTSWNCLCHKKFQVCFFVYWCNTPLLSHSNSGMFVVDDFLLLRRRWRDDVITVVKRRSTGTAEAITYTSLDTKASKTKTATLTLF